MASERDILRVLKKISEDSDWSDLSEVALSAYSDVDVSAPSVLVVNHGVDPNVARPDGAAAVYWIGSVDPNNAELWDLSVVTA